MRTGRIPETVLKRSVLKNITGKSRRLVDGPAAGRSCGRMTVEDGKHMIFTTVSVGAPPDIAGRKAFYRLANDISAAGGRLAGMLITLYLPVAGSEQELKQIMRQLAGLAEAHGADILGGHTEVMETLSEPLLSLTGTGVADAGVNVGSANFMPGMDIVMTKWAGAPGAAEMVKRERGKNGVLSRLPDEFLDRAERYADAVSSTEDAGLAVQWGGTALYSVGAKGVFGALWEVGEASGTGIRVYLKKIPVRQETVEVCECFDCNPYLTASDGVLLAGTPDGERMVELFIREGIPAAVIGTVTDDRNRVIINGEEKRFLVPPSLGK